MKLGLTTSGLWKLRKEIALATCMNVSFTRFGFGVDMIAGWGHKSTAAKARDLARRQEIPYLALEDGFLRSVHPGTEERPLSLVLDRTGIYYDCRQPSDLEFFINKRSSVRGDSRRAHNAIAQLKEKRLSKYNNHELSDASALKLHSNTPADRVLVIDQTLGDASIEGASATRETFESALVTAVNTNPDSEVLVKVHPETALGRKAGHYSVQRFEELAQLQPRIRDALLEGRLRLTPEAINPWGLLEACSTVYCVSSQLGFEALLAGCDVHCFGVPFYAGWGLTHDYNPVRLKRRNPASLADVFAAVYFDYCRFIDYGQRAVVPFEKGVEILETRLAESRRDF